VASAITTLDLSEHVFMITGANTGIGETAAYQLAKRGAQLILACRKRDRAAHVLANIAEHYPQAKASFVNLDLSYLASVRQCASVVNDMREPVNCLILNAGVGGQRGVTKEGFELHFGTNHLGHYLLTRLLLERIRNTPTPRIVTVASNSHKQARAIKFDQLQSSTRSYSGMREYAVSKLCNILFTRELQRRCDERYGVAAKRVATYALNPGRVATDVWRRIPAPFRWLFKKTMITADQGGSYIVKCAASEEFASHVGRYYSRGLEHEPSALAQNAELALELWNRSAGWLQLSAEL
jgi:retinol dehydrogenase 12